MKKIVLTGGGTAGHVTPNIALIPHLKEAGYEVREALGTERRILGPRGKSDEIDALNAAVKAAVISVRTCCAG